MEEKNNKDSSTPREELSPIVLASTSPRVTLTYIERNKMISEGQYLNVENEDFILPNNEQELNNLPLQHILLKYAWGSNFSSPIYTNLKAGGLKVLDVGCGPGAWLLDMCKDYPLCDFIGLDISPVFPSLDSLPPNIEFIQSDALNGLPFKDNTFDFVHQRLWVSVLSRKQWETAIHELIRVCKVGGWLELSETEFVYYREGINKINLRSSLLTFFYLKKLFINNVCGHISHLLKSSGSFNEINEEECNIPIGVWAGKFGELSMKITYEGYKAFFPELKLIMGLSEKEFYEILDRFVVESNDFKTFHKNFRFFCCKVL